MFVVSSSLFLNYFWFATFVISELVKVGKTSLMKRYAANDFSDKRRPTIGADFMTKEIIYGDQPMLLQVWMVLRYVFFV